MQKPATPTYRRHRAGGRDRAFVELDGQRHYVGTYGTPESIQQYDRLVAEWLSSGRTQRGEPNDLTIVELCARFLRHAKAHYRRADGTQTGTIYNFKAVVRHLKALYGQTPAMQFGPLALKAVRQKMVEAGWSRGTINQGLSFLRGIFRWAAAEEMIPISVHAALRAVEPLRRGRTTARETDPVKPVPPAHIRAIRHFVSRQVWAMIELQRLTGMRPGEVVQMRALDLEMGGRVWTYVPQTHKTQHHGHSRTVYLGPRAQTIVGPFLRTELEAPLFSPRDARNEKAAAAKTHRRPAQAPSPRKTARRLRDAFDVHSYRRAIERACDSAGVPRWKPNQLRHNAATRLRREFGIDLAQTILGHRIGSAITEIYAEANVRKAREIMGRVG